MPHPRYNLCGLFCKIHCLTSWHRDTSSSHAGGINMAKGSNIPDEALPGRVVDLGGLVNYQEGAVVSRALVSRSTGTVTLFAFDKGQQLSEHTSPFDALVQVLDGELDVTISGSPLRLDAGQIVIMPADKPHALRAPKRAKMMLVMVRS
jgi:quercetin dioxygenase-like cupin family protein